MKEYERFVYDSIDTWNADVNAAHSCLSLDSADERLQNRIAICLDNHPERCAFVARELRSVGYTEELGA